MACRLFRWRRQPVLPTGFTRRPFWRRWFGRRSERAGARFLRKLGYRILGQNIEDARGEIDLLALDGQTLVVVEVRSSETRSFGELAESVNRDKQRRLTNALLRFLQKRKIEGVGVRFDILAIRWPPGHSRPDIRHYRSAFQMAGTYQFRS